MIMGWVFSPRDPQKHRREKGSNDMENGDIILVDIGGQYEFAHVKQVGLVGNGPARYAEIETLSGRGLGGVYNGLALAVGNNVYQLQRAGTFVPGYAAACEHFGY